MTLTTLRGRFVAMNKTMGFWWPFRLMVIWAAFPFALLFALTGYHQLLDAVAIMVDRLEEQSEAYVDAIEKTETN